MQEFRYFYRNPKSSLQAPTEHKYLGQALPCKVEAAWENYHLIVYGKILILW